MVGNAEPDLIVFPSSTASLSRSAARVSFIKILATSSKPTDKIARNSDLFWITFFSRERFMPLFMFFISRGFLYHFYAWPGQDYYHMQHLSISLIAELPGLAGMARRKRH